VTHDLLESLKPQLDAMQHMYKAAFEAGRRSAFAEMAPGLKKLQEQFDELYPNFKDTRELPLSKQQGETQP
jgi:hypothetical protein